jgi:putative thioredoxin
MFTDVTDATFEVDILERSDTQPVVVDLWAPWCEPCKSLGPILERVVDETEGVILAKVNVDENPQISAAFSVQSIPAVFAIRNRAVVDGFMGAVPEAEIRQFTERLMNPPSETDLLVEAGDEASLRAALELEPGHVAGVTGLATLLVETDRSAEALALLARIPESAATRLLAAKARLAQLPDAEILGDDWAVDQRLNVLLDQVKVDDVARQEFIDLLEAMDSEDERKTRYRKALTSRLY